MGDADVLEVQLTKQIGIGFGWNIGGFYLTFPFLSFYLVPKKTQNNKWFKFYNGFNF